MANKSLNTLIDKKLDAVLPPATEEPKLLHRAMRYSVFSGGKRIRPVIVIEAARACGADAGKALPAACAVELVHTYSLIHDDLPSMDDDDLRRAIPSCHKAFGEAEAILAGDALLTRAFGVIAESYPPKTSAAIIKRLSDALGSRGMVGGQAMDMGKGHKTAAVLDRIDGLKTGKLFEASAALGAIAAGAAESGIKALQRYGEYFGSAFQIADDISDADRYLNKTSIKKAAASCIRIAGEAKKAVSRFGRRAEGLNALADAITKDMTRWKNS